MFDSYTHAQLAKTAVADRLRAADRARTVQAAKVARAAQEAHSAASQPSHRKSAVAARGIHALAWLRARVTAA